MNYNYIAILFFLWLPIALSDSPPRYEVEIWDEHPMEIRKWYLAQEDRFNNSLNEEEKRILSVARQRCDEECLYFPHIYLHQTQMDTVFPELTKKAKSWYDSIRSIYGYAAKQEMLEKYSTIEKSELNFIKSLNSAEIIWFKDALLECKNRPCEDISTTLSAIKNESQTVFTKLTTQFNFASSVTEFQKLQNLLERFNCCASWPDYNRT